MGKGIDGKGEGTGEKTGETGWYFREMKKILSKKNFKIWLQWDHIFKFLFSH